MSINVNWIKCQGDVWCPLSTVDLSHPHFVKMDGVYVIWHGGPKPTVVYVGKGQIKERLQATGRIRKSRSSPGLVFSSRGQA